MAWPWLLLACVAVSLSAFVSACEMGLYCLNPIRLELGVRRGERRSATLSRLLTDRAGMIAVLMAGNNVADYLATACVVYVFIRNGLSEQRAELWTALLLTPIVFVFGEVLPKNLVRREADTFMSRVALPLSLMNTIVRATGLVMLLDRLARGASRLLGLDPHAPLSSLEPRQQVMAMLREGVGAGVLSDQQSAIAERVMNLSSVGVRAAMIGRGYVHSVRFDTPRAEFIRLARTHNCSRMPVVSRTDRVVGILNVFDVLVDQENHPLTHLMTEPMTVHADENVTSVLTAMQRRGTPMAIVSDRHGQFLGIVTLKDLIEEIVGDLQAW
jgi:putative hemolysin